MGEDSYLDASYEERYELAQYEEPPYDCDERPDPEDWDDEDGFPCNVRDLSDADALASGGARTRTTGATSTSSPASGLYALARCCWIRAVASWRDLPRGAGYVWLD